MVGWMSNCCTGRPHATVGHPAAQNVSAASITSAGICAHREGRPVVLLPGCDSAGTHTPSAYLVAGFLVCVPALEEVHVAL
jgi:hypothetical protein